MKTLEQWINEKIESLKTEKGYRDVRFDYASPIEISKNSIKQNFLLSKVNDDIKVEEVERSSLSDIYIKGVEVVFGILKPRKRKYDDERFYLKLI